MRFVVGLGNPGAEYDGTRHNVGFDIVDLLAQRHGFGADKPFKKALVAKGRIAGDDVLLVRPQTYMNLSGDAVGAIMRYYKGSPEDVIVIHDELDFDPGQVRLKSGGGHGGHNGLRSLISHIGNDFFRIRVGVGKPRPGRGADHVLSRFGKAETDAMQEAMEDAADAVEAFLREGKAAAMNTFNRK